MRAGKMIIGNYSAKAVDLLLPELLNGMTDERWRIRVRTSIEVYLPWLPPAVLTVSFVWLAAIVRLTHRRTSV